MIQIMNFKKIIIFFIFYFPLFTFSAPQTKPPIKLLVLGDSLTEGYGISSENAFPALVEKKLNALKKETQWKVLNAGLSGATSASAVSRLKWHLKDKPEFMILALGANDGLRGLPLKDTEANLKSCIDLAKKNGIKVFLAGMYLPPNYGVEYGKKFRQIYIDLARKEKIEMIDFLLKDVAADPKLNLPDGIHPNEKGHAIMAENIFKFIQKQTK